MPAAPLRRNRDFVLLQAGQLLSDSGTQLTSIAYPLLALAVTGSAAQAGLVAFARVLPLALLALPAGIAADRWSRRRIMVGADALRAFALAGLGAAVVLDEAALWAIVLVAFVEGAGTATFSAAQAGALRAVVPRAQLPAAISVRTGRQAIVTLVGPPLGGALFGLARALPFLADAASYALSTASLLAIGTQFEEQRAPDRSPLRTRVAEGFGFLWREPFLRTCALLFGLANFLGPGLLLAVVVVGDEQGLSARRIGALVAAFGTCLLIGSFASPLVRRVLSVRAVLVLELWSWLGCAAFLLRPSVYVLVAGMLPAALAIPSTDSVVHGYRIAMTPDRLLGRSESVRSMISLGVAPLGPLLAGALLGITSPRVTIAVFAALALVLAAWGTLSPALRAAPALAELDGPTPAAARAGGPAAAPSPAGRTRRRCRGPA